MKIPTVAIIGRPNVGKSTLFNSITGGRAAITASEAGTTRDRISLKVQKEEIDYYLVDTGGITKGQKDQPLESEVKKQSELAIEEADLILFVVDQKEGLSTDDYEIIEKLRKRIKKIPVLLVVNKCDFYAGQTDLANYYQLGLGTPLGISATHKTGFAQLECLIVDHLKKAHFITKEGENDQEDQEQIEEQIPQIAIVGKPNVGKSSLINAWLNQVRVITSDVPGTTRDAIDTPIQIQKKKFNLIDTAGIKRAGKIKEGIEKFSFVRTLSAIERCDIAALVIDSTEKISHQDQKIADLILRAHKGLLLVVNKWDVKTDPDEKEEERQKRFIRRLRINFPFIPWAPTIFTSAYTKKNMTQIFELLGEIAEERKKRIKTSELNEFIKEIKMGSKGGGKGSSKIFYCTQVSVNPPHFVFFINKEKMMHFSDQRYLENQLRKKFGYNGTAIKISLREKNPERPS